MPLHSATKKGITCVDLKENMVATGGNDNNALVYDKTQEKIISTLSGSKKKVTNVKFVDSESLLVCSEENRANVFNYSTAKGKVTFKLEGHNAAITGCDIHPNGNLAVLASMDKTFSFHDLSQGKTLGFSSLDENST